MKKILLIPGFALLMGFSYAQTAANFTCADCNGTTLDLFTELDQGKVVVICWVMPCATCIAPAKTSYNVVQSYQTANPGKVFYYLVDDYANTVCSSLNSWGASNGIYGSAWSLRFSNSVVDMEAYGTPGMPKVAVIGCNSHHVFYNVNGTVNAASIQAAIDSALNCTSAIPVNESDPINLNLYPMPANEVLTVEFNGTARNPVTLTIIPVDGSSTPVFETTELCIPGRNKRTIETRSLSSGLYLVKLSDGKNSSVKKISIIH